MDRETPWPYEYGSDLHWLWGWAERISLHLQEQTVNRLSSFVFRPDALADDALIRYSMYYPGLVQQVRDAVNIVEEEFKTFDESDDSLFALSDAMQFLERRLRTAIKALESAPRIGVPDRYAAPVAPTPGSWKGPDGPFGTDGFRWKGIEYRELRPMVHRLILHLWVLPDRTAEFEELALPVFDDHAIDPDANSVGSIRRDANAFFREHHIPLLIRIRDRKVELLEVDSA